VIGFYDSGIGGLTILREVQYFFPNVLTAYFGDTLQCPIGDKTNQEIINYTKSGVSFLFDRGCELVILACNTATAVAFSELNNNWLPMSYPSKKILGIVYPVAEKMQEICMDKNINIGIMATTATIRSGIYIQELAKVGFRNIYEIPCVGLASSIECDNLKQTGTILDYIFAINSDTLPKLDVVVLACTHYPIVAEIIFQKLQKYGAKKNIKLLSQGVLVAEKLGKYLLNNLEIINGQGINSYFVTSNPHDFQEKMRNIFAIEGGVNLV
jgi:glutamate racemase